MRSRGADTCTVICALSAGPGGVDERAAWCVTSTSWTTTSVPGRYATPRTTSPPCLPRPKRQGASAQDFLYALAVAYRVQACLLDLPTMRAGRELPTPLAFSAAADELVFGERHGAVALGAVAAVVLVSKVTLVSSCEISRRFERRDACSATGRRARPPARRTAAWRRRPNASCGWAPSGAGTPADHRDRDVRRRTEAGRLHAARPNGLGIPPSDRKHLHHSGRADRFAVQQSKHRGGAAADDPRDLAEWVCFGLQK